MNAPHPGVRFEGTSSSMFDAHLFGCGLSSRYDWGMLEMTDTATLVNGAPVRRQP